MDFVTDDSWIVSDKKTNGWELVDQAQFDQGIGRGHELGPADIEPWKLPSDLHCAPICRS